MKKAKISIIFFLIGAIVCTTLGVLAKEKARSDVFEGDTSYMEVENLALDLGEGKIHALTDGDNDSCLRSTSKQNVQITLDLKETKRFNSVVLKEKGLNAKTFSILVSTDAVTFEPVYQGDKIEYHRLCAFDSVEARYLRLIISEADQIVKLKELEIYQQTPVQADAFRNVGYMVSNEFTGVMENTALSRAEQKEQVLAILNRYSIKSMTHLNFHCGVGFNEKGVLFLQKAEDDQQKQMDDLALLVECLRQVGRPDLKINFVMAWGTGNPAANPAMSDNKEAMIQNMITFANQFGFNGIDIDYEFPQSEYDYRTFGDFLIALKAKMDVDMKDRSEVILSCRGFW